MLPRYILKYISNMMHLIFDEEAVADLGIWEGVSTGTKSKMQGSGGTAFSRCQGFSLRNLTTFTVLLTGIKSLSRVYYSSADCSIRVYLENSYINQ